MDLSTFSDVRQGKRCPGPGSLATWRVEWLELERWIFQFCHLWKANWEDVATNIKQQLRAKGFQGDVEVRFDAQELKQTLIINVFRICGPELLNQICRLVQIYVQENSCKWCFAMIQMVNNSTTCTWDWIDNEEDLRIYRPRRMLWRLYQCELWTLEIDISEIQVLKGAKQHKQCRNNRWQNFVRAPITHMLSVWAPGWAPSKDPFFFSKECDEDAELLNFEVLSGCGLLLWLPYLYCRSDVVTWQRFFGEEMPRAFGAFGPFAKVIVESRFEIHVDIHRLEPQHLSGRFHEFHEFQKFAQVQNLHCRYWEMLSAGVGKNQTDVFFYFYFSKIFPTKSTLWKNGSPTAKSRCVPISDPTFCRPWCRRGIPIHLSPESPSGDS